MHYLPIACIAMVVAVVTFTVAPNGHVNTRVFSGTPPRHVTVSNWLLLLVAVASLAVVGLSVANLAASVILALVTSIVALVLLALDVGGTFPASDRSAPPHVLVLQVADLATSGVLLVVSLDALLRCAS